MTTSYNPFRFLTSAYFSGIKFKNLDKYHNFLINSGCYDILKCKHNCALVFVSQTSTLVFSELCFRINGEHAFSLLTIKPAVIKVKSIFFAKKQNLLLLLVV